MVPTVKVCQDFVQGDSFDMVIIHNPGFDITAAVFELTLSKIEGGDPILSVEYTVPNDLDSADGKATVPVLSAKTSLVSPGKYFASLKRTLAGGEVKTILRSGTRTGDGSLVKKVEVYKNLDITP